MTLGNDPISLTWAGSDYLFTTNSSANKAEVSHSQSARWMAARCSGVTIELENISSRDTGPSVELCLAIVRYDVATAERRLVHGVVPLLLLKGH